MKSKHLKLLFVGLAVLVVLLLVRSSQYREGFDRAKIFQNYREPMMSGIRSYSWEQREIMGNKIIRRIRLLERYREQLTREDMKTNGDPYHYKKPWVEINIKNVSNDNPDNPLPKLSAVRVTVWWPSSRTKHDAAYSGQVVFKATSLDDLKNKQTMIMDWFAKMLDDAQYGDRYVRGDRPVSNFNAYYPNL